MIDWRDRMAWILTNRLAWPQWSQGDVVFHAYGYRYEGGEPGHRWFRTVSICGRTIDEWAEGHGSSRFTMFDEIVAQRIARPCQRCYECSNSDSDHLGFSAEGGQA